MATFQFALISPERLMFSGEVEHVVVPSSEGDFGVLAQHAPLVAMLRPGIVKILAPSERQFVVRGGFAEVNSAGLTILADFAMPMEEFDREALAGQIKDLEEDVADTAPGPVRDRLAHRLAELRGVQEALTR